MDQTVFVFLTMLGIKDSYSNPTINGYKLSPSGLSVNHVDLKASTDDAVERHWVKVLLNLFF